MASDLKLSQPGCHQIDSIQLDGGVRIASGTAAPSDGTSGTLAGKAGPGSIYIRSTTGVVYFNTNTKASPTWTPLTIN